MAPRHIKTILDSIWSYVTLTEFGYLEGHGDRYIGSLFRVDEPVPDDSYRHKINLTAKQVRTIMEYLGDP